MTPRDEPLRDTGRNPKIPDEQQHMSKAHVFDTLVETSVALNQTLKIFVFVIAGFGLLSTIMTGLSALILRNGQQETRELIAVMSRQQQRCLDTTITTRKE